MVPSPWWWTGYSRGRNNAFVRKSVNFSGIFVRVRPAFKKIKASLDQYDVIYLGYPNWWNSHPRLINTFIEAYGLKGKTVIPFMTSGGSDIKNSVKNLRKDYPEVNWEDGKLLNGATQEEVDAWVKK